MLSRRTCFLGGWRPWAREPSASSWISTCTLTGHEMVEPLLCTLPPHPSSTLPHPPSPPHHWLSLLLAPVTRRHCHLSPPRAHDTAPSLRHSALRPLIIPQQAPHSAQPLRGTRPQVSHSVLHPRAVSYMCITRTLTNPVILLQTPLHVRSIAPE